MYVQYAGWAVSSRCCTTIQSFQYVKRKLRQQGSLNNIQSEWPHYRRMINDWLGKLQGELKRKIRLTRIAKVLGTLRHTRWSRLIAFRWSWEKLEAGARGPKLKGANWHPTLDCSSRRYPPGRSDDYPQIVPYGLSSSGDNQSHRLDIYHLCHLCHLCRLCRLGPFC